MNNIQLNNLRSFRSSLIEDLNICNTHKLLCMDKDAEFGKLMTLTVRSKITTAFIEILNKLIRSRCLLLDEERTELLNKMKIITKRIKIQLAQVSKLSKIIYISTMSSMTVNQSYYSKLIGAVYRMILFK